MALLPTLPVLPGESMASYLNRVAQRHGDVTLMKFLDIIELSQQEVLYPRPATVQRVAQLTGQSETRLQEMTFIRLDKRQRSIGGHTVYTEFLDKRRHRFCPMCLKDDLRIDSPSGGIPIGRIEWQFRSVRVCNRHGVLLSESNVSNYAHRFQRLPELNLHDLDLDGMAASSVGAGLSALQAYILDRIAGKAGPKWLDDQPMDLAVRACEMLGIVLLCGSAVNLKTVTDKEWSEAADIGFGYASLGAEGVCDGLRVIYDQHVRRCRSGGPQKAFGRLYQWLQFSKNNKEQGTISGVLRDFILDHFPISEGSNLLGEPVERQRVHSVYTLSRKAKIHPQTLHHALVVAGLVQEKGESLPFHQVFNVRAGEEVVANIRNSISTKRLPEYLNCNRSQAEQLVRSGVLPRLAPRDKVRAGLLTNVLKKDADAFLKALMDGASYVRKPSQGMLPIVDAAETARWPAMDIVAAILAGDLKRIEICNRDLKFMGVMVNPVDVKEVLAGKQAPGLMSQEDAVGYLGLPVHCLIALTRLTRADGLPFMTAHWVANAKGAQRRMFDQIEVQAFKKAYVSLREYAEEMGVGIRSASCRLKGRGVKPIVPRSALNYVVYDRRQAFAL